MDITRIERQQQMRVRADVYIGLSHNFTEEGKKLLKDIDKVYSVKWYAHK
ncbi:hypothetical protein [Staphylococcus pseudintermedius]|nr:hypothetical protein [Staphylococcus pseudintermedius]